MVQGSFRETERVFQESFKGVSIKIEKVCIVVLRGFKGKICIK